MPLRQSFAKTFAELDKNQLSNSSPFSICKMPFKTMHLIIELFPNIKRTKLLLKSGGPPQQTVFPNPFLMLLHKTSLKLANCFLEVKTP